MISLDSAVDPATDSGAEGDDEDSVVFDDHSDIDLTEIREAIEDVEESIRALDSNMASITTSMGTSLSLDDVAMSGVA